MQDKLCFTEIHVLQYHYQHGREVVHQLPGGNPQKGESLSETIRRELEEELGLQIEIGPLVLVGEVQVKNKEKLHCVFEGVIKSGKPKVNPSHSKARSVDWIDIDLVESLNLYPNIGKQIKAAIQANSGRFNPYIGQIDQKWFE
jgi:ADP-ribose pyrophosphatase YjhB (NUDIX family)